MTDMIINRLPSRTWNWLKVNETKLSWDDTHTTELPGEHVTASAGETARFRITGDGEYSRKKIEIHAKKDESITVFMDLAPGQKLAVYTALTMEENAHIRLIQLQHGAEESLLYNAIHADSGKNAQMELIQIYLGKGNLYSDMTIDLQGDGSSFLCDMGYTGRGSQIFDMNEVVNHFGKRTKSEIHAAGALQEHAEKIFRGTIDFKTGAADSVGNEQETVLMLGDDVKNKTVPVILCSEENVVGNHGATIGELDEDTMFYFASRGINKEQAENMMARAAIEHLKDKINDEAFAAVIEEEIGEE